MIDEMDELGRANPVAAESLEPSVAMERNELIGLLEADSADRGRTRRLGRRRTLSAPRAGYVGAMAGAAAVLVGVLMIAGWDEPSDTGVADDATTVSQPAPAVLDDGSTTTGPADPTPSTAPPAPTGSPDPTTPNPPAPGADHPPASDDPAPTTTVVADIGQPQAAPPGDGPFRSTTDLVAVHFDFADSDDGHAAVAARELATSFGLSPHVIGGTQASDRNNFFHPYRDVMTAAWGTDWIDATAEGSDAVNRTAQRWLATVDDGGRVWVAEGGVSDFTADVVAEIQRLRPDLDTTQAVFVVQHNERNENQSSPEKLRFVEANTTYQRIDDGNSANATADLNQRSDVFEAAARAGRHRNSWTAAFEYRPAADLDFSDTVALLYILGVDTDAVADPDDFARQFMG